MLLRNELSVEEVKTRAENLRQLFTADRAEKFNALWVATMEAVNSLRVEPVSASIFVAESGKHSLDQECDIDFTNIGVSIKQLMDPNTREKRMRECVTELPITAQHLIDELKVFSNVDGNAQRKATYQQTINYLKMINDACSSKSPTLKRD